MRKKRVFFYNIIITTIVFLALYWKTIFGGMTLFYKDVGVDTINIIYPLQKFILSNYKNLFSYSFQLGLGAGVYTRCISIVNPIIAILILMGETNQIYYYLIGSYVCVIICSLVGYEICIKFSKSEWASIAGGLIWAFSGWIVLWGQQLPFMIAYSFFSAYVCALVYFESSSWKKWLLLIISLVLLITCGYYWLYMAGIFGCLFIFGRGFVKGVSCKCIILEEFELLVSGILSMLIAAFKLLPDLQVFLNSCRSGNLSTKSPMGVIYSIDYLITDLARIFSNNTLGYASNYSGSYNYYEGTILWGTQLGIFAVVFWVIQREKGKRDKRKYIVLSLIVIALILPVVTHFITFDETKQRWTFMLIMLEIILISMLLARIKKCNLRKTILYSLIIYGIIMGLLLLANYLNVISVQKSTIKLSIIFIIIYALLLQFSKRYNTKIIACVWVLIICCNLIVENYVTYNNREVISKDEFENSYYNDGTDKAIEYIKSVDKGLYRIQKDYMSVFLNDPLVQEYNGVTEYNETEPDSVAKFMYYNSIPFARDADYSKASKYINLTADNYNISTLVGVKYLLSKEDKQIENYKKLKKIDNIYIYINEQNLEFGYMYDRMIDVDKYNKLSQYDKGKSLLYGFYLTNKDTDLDLERFEIADISNFKLDDGIEQLRKQEIKNVSYDDNVYKANVNNSKNNATMFCIPIFYDSSWHAYVDGKEVETYNINGGITGVIVNSGEHEVVLKYSNKLISISIMISIVGMLICVAFLGYIKNRFKERN